MGLAGTDIFCELLLGETALEAEFR